MEGEPSDLLFSLDLKCVCMLDEMLEAARYLEQNTTKKGKYVSIPPSDFDS
jgi:hypothetical protein